MIKREEINRKLIGWTLAGTGMVSLALWGWGKISREGLETKVSFEVKPTARIGERFEMEIEEIAATASGTWAVYVYSVDDGSGYGVNEKMEMPGASILKVPAMLAVEREVEEGRLKLEDEWVLEEADRSGGSGGLQYKPAGTRLTIMQVLEALGKNSDNTAWVMVNRRLGYKEIEMEIEKLGMEETDYRKLTTTARDVVKMWQGVYKRPDLWPYLEKSIYEDRISLGLPEGVRLVHKVGTDDGVWSDSGVVMGEKPFVLVILNKGVEREEAQKLVPALAREIWKYEAGQSQESEKSDE